VFHNHRRRKIVNKHNQNNKANKDGFNREEVHSFSANLALLHRLILIHSSAFFAALVAFVFSPLPHMNSNQKQFSAALSRLENESRPAGEQKQIFIEAANLLGLFLFCYLLIQFICFCYLCSDGSVPVDFVVREIETRATTFPLSCRDRIFESVSYLCFGANLRLKDKVSSLFTILF